VLIYELINEVSDNINYKFPCSLYPTVLLSSHKIFSLHKLLAGKGMMTSLSQAAQYMDCCQHSRQLFLMISSDLEDRRYLDNVGAFILSEYTLIFNLLVNISKFNISNIYSNERNKFCAGV
jgi:hypothetical protein